MDASDWTAAVSVAIAAAALLLSLWTFNRQRRAEGRANLTADWDSLRAITNYGPGAARDLRVTRAGGDDAAETVTRGYVPALQTVRMYAPDRMLGASPEIQLSITWSDNRRARQTYTVELNPPPRTPQPPKGSAVDNAVRKIAEDATRRMLRDRDRDSRLRRRLP